MLLSVVEITDFLSVKGTIKVNFDRKVTVLLGSNDHGKTNILEAVKHLNDDVPITEDEANWDAEGLPAIRFGFSMLPADRNEWKNLIDELTKRKKELKRKMEELVAAQKKRDSASQVDGALEATEPAEEDEEKEEQDPDEETAESEEPEVTVSLLDLPESALDPSPSTFTLTRQGAGTKLQFEGVDVDRLPPEMSKFIKSKKPRVELFRALTGTLQDSTTASSIVTDEYEFLQGVFFYAGLDPRTSAAVFTQDDKTTRALDKASAQLDSSLRSLWGQGTELHFELRHKGNSIEFLADDPAIKSRKARMSKRSAGVTQFFRVSLVLYARRKKNPANSYIYLFDEPGVLLHPQGQRDLLQVFEQLADENQIVYATHSLFLLNQNFPERHRLIYKDDEGTKVDQKPYRQNWKLATDALGVYLTSNVLFSNRILLVEGDSDPIYLYELFRQLNKAGDIDVDLNCLGIMGFYDHQNLSFLLQIFKREGQDSSVFALVDGDSQGKSILQKAASLCKRLEVSTHRLPEGRSIEDFCVNEEAFLQAVGRTLVNACEAEGKDVPAKLEESIRNSWEQRKATLEKNEKRTKADKAEKEEDKTAGKWFNDIATELIEDKASKVVLARTYAEICRESSSPVSKDKVKDAKALCLKIAQELKLPAVRAVKTIEVTSGSPSGNVK